MFSFISKSWAGKPLLTAQSVVELIGSTRTQKGLMVRAALDTKTYRKGIEVSDDVLTSLWIKRARFHGEWNYTVLPQN